MCSQGLCYLRISLPRHGRMCRSVRPRSIFYVRHSEQATSVPANSFLFLESHHTKPPPLLARPYSHARWIASRSQADSLLPSYASECGIAHVVRAAYPARVACPLACGLLFAHAGCFRGGFRKRAVHGLHGSPAGPCHVHLGTGWRGSVLH